MSNLTLSKQVDIYCEGWHQLNILYEDYAKSLGLSYTSLYVLDIIFSNQESCTQKLICQQTFLPKQTVNAIIISFLKQGIIELTELESDRRNKVIRITDSGENYIKKIITKMKNAEYKAMEKLDSERRTALLENTKQYVENFRECMLEND